MVLTNQKHESCFYLFAKVISFSQNVSQHFAFFEHDYQNGSEHKTTSTFLQESRSQRAQLSRPYHQPDISCATGCDVCSAICSEPVNMFFMGLGHLPTQCHRTENGCKERAQKHNKHKSSSGHTHFVHGRCPSSLLVMFIVNCSASHTSWKKVHFKKIMPIRLSQS